MKAKSRATQFLIFNKKYFLIALLLFFIEVFIASYLHDRIIRPYVGDLLVVIFLYCLLKAFVNLPVLHAAVIVLVFSIIIEILQYFKFIYLLGLSESRLANLVLGNLFEWIDILAYLLGFLFILAAENWFSSKKQRA